jgi:hypothetical protein
MKLEVHVPDFDKMQPLSDDDKKRIEADLSNAIYAVAVKFYEGLEVRRAVWGNGHHMAQRIAGQAVEQLKERWQ